MIGREDLEVRLCSAANRLLVYVSPPLTPLQFTWNIVCSTTSYIIALYGFFFFFFLTISWGFWGLSLFYKLKVLWFEHLITH